MCSTPSMVEVVEVVFVSTSRGDGSPGNPSRSVYQYWSKDGRLLAEADGLFEFPDQASYMAAERLLQLRAQAEIKAATGEGGAHA
jgi:hypothetical protein